MKKSYIILAIPLVILISFCGFTVSGKSIFSQIKDVVYEITTGDVVCRHSVTSRGYENLSSEETLNKEYDTAKDAILNYPWTSQYLPVADVYCSIPFTISDIQISDNYKNLSEYLNFTDVQINSNTFYFTVKIEQNPKTNKFKIIEVNRRFV